MDSERLFIYGLVLFVLLGFGIRAFIDYKDYKGTINQFLYANYLIDYYWHYYVRRDNSKSALLQQKLGAHRMIHAQISDNTNQPVARFVTVIHSHGITLINYMNPHGIIAGKNTDKNWVIRRNEENGSTKNYRIPNPLTYMDTYKKHLLDATGLEAVDRLVAIGGNDEIKLSLPYDIVRYDELIEALQQSDAGYGLSPDEIEEAFHKLTDKEKK